MLSPHLRGGIGDVLCAACPKPQRVLLSERELEVLLIPSSQACTWMVGQSRSSSVSKVLTQKLLLEQAERRLFAVKVACVGIS